MVKLSEYIIISKYSYLAIVATYRLVPIIILSIIGMKSIKHSTSIIGEISSVRCQFHNLHDMILIVMVIHLLYYLTYRLHTGCIQATYGQVGFIKLKQLHFQKGRSKYLILFCKQLPVVYLRFYAVENIERLLEILCCRRKTGSVHKNQDL